MADFIEFYWQVPEDGFQWLDSKGHAPGKVSAGTKGRFLIPHLKPGARGSALHYRVFDVATGLVRIFAELDPTEEAVLRFANRYGLLGIEQTGVEVTPSNAKQNEFVLQTGETLAVWTREIASMRHMVALWELTRQGKAEAIAEFIRWKGKNRSEVWPRTEVYYKGPRTRFQHFPTMFTIASERDGSLDRFKPGDVILPGWFALQRLMNKKLVQHSVMPKLLWRKETVDLPPAPASAAGAGTRPRQRRGLESKLSMYFAPFSLIGAMWLQLAHAITGNKNYRQCEQCSKWFELAAEVRLDGKFCQGSCRSKAYRARQSEAKRLHASGVSATEIAKRLNSEEDVVKGWIGK